MAKIYNLFNETNRQKLPMEQEEEIITKMYEEYYANETPEDTYPEYIGNCYLCTLPISEYEPLWKINRTNKGDSHIEESSLVICEECLLDFIKYKKEA